MYPTFVYRCEAGHERVSHTRLTNRTGQSLPATTMPCNGKNADGSPCKLPGTLVVHEAEHDV